MVANLSMLKAWCTLAVIDMLLRVLPFTRFKQLMVWFPASASSPSDQWSVVGQICHSVERARTYYFKTSWCLQASAAAVLLLRRRGIDAHLVIGVRRIPFYAHAWVEVQRRIVLNTRPHTTERYKVIARC